MTICNSTEGHYAVGVCFPPYNGSVVIVKNGALFCTTCQQATCAHSAFVADSCNTDLAVVNAMLDCVRVTGSSDNQQKRQRRNDCKSTVRIPFAPCPAVSSSLLNLDLLINSQSVTPEVDFCSHCGLTATMNDSNMQNVVAITCNKILRLRGLIIFVIICSIDTLHTLVARLIQLMYK